MPKVDRPGAAWGRDGARRAGARGLAVGGLVVIPGRHPGAAGAQRGREDGTGRRRPLGFLETPKKIEKIKKLKKLNILK